MTQEPYHEWQSLTERGQKFLDSFLTVVDDLTRQLRDARHEIERLSKFASHQASALGEANNRIRSLEIRFGQWEEKKEETHATTTK